MKSLLTVLIIGTFAVTGNAATLNCISSNKIHTNLTVTQTDERLMVEKYFEGQLLKEAQLALTSREFLSLISYDIIQGIIF